MHAHSTNRSSPNTQLSSTTSLIQSVCGRLDPSSRSKKTKTSGWRYLQCADKVDELRVLLPPRPAAIYANLLKVEAHNIAKNDPHVDQDLQQIRQLKEAVVKKCQHLALKQLHAHTDSNNVPRKATFEAPEDFKLRRLEDWWLGMEAKLKIKETARQGDHTERRSKHSKGHSRTLTYTQIDQAAPINGHHENGRVYQTVNGQAYHVPPEAHSSPHTQRGDTSRKKRPVPLAVSSPSLPGSDKQPSPSKAYASYNPSRTSPITHYASPQSPSAQSTHVVKPQARHSTQYKPHYSSNQITSPMDTQHSPWVDPRCIPASPMRTEALAATYTTPVGQSDIILTTHNGKQYMYNPSAANHSPTSIQADPSLLKTRFQATYQTASSTSSSSPSSNGSKHSTLSPQQATFGRDTNIANYSSRDLLPTGTGPSHHIRSSTVMTMPTPNHYPSISEREHRRRSTVDCDDTDRSVPRPKNYMYRSSVYTRSHDGGSNDILGQNIASTLSSGSSPSHESANHPSNGSPGKHHAHATAYGTVLNGSPNLLPPTSGQGQVRTRRESHENVVKLTSQAQAPGTPHQLRRTYSRRTMRDHSPNGAQTHVEGYGTWEYQGYEPKSPRRMTMPVPEVQQQQSYQYADEDAYQRGRTRRGEAQRRPHYSYDTSPHRSDVVIPDSAYTRGSANSARNSRYTSGGSSVSEPVIPDESLIKEAERSRNKADRVRQRLVPFASSSEEGGRRRYDSDSDDSYSDISMGEGGYSGFYKPPYRTRDGYGSGYGSEFDGTKSRPASRPPSRPPSRGILKRSSSMCSQRSNKSVRIELTRDRKALEEVRDAEDKVDKATKYLDEVHRNNSRATEAEIQKATEALSKAKESHKEKFDEYQAILKSMKAKEADENMPHYV